MVPRAWRTPTLCHLEPPCPPPASLPSPPPTRQRVTLSTVVRSRLQTSRSLSSSAPVAFSLARPQGGGPCPAHPRSRSPCCTPPGTQAPPCTDATSRGAPAPSRLCPVSLPGPTPPQDGRLGRWPWGAFAERINQPPSFPVMLPPGVRLCPGGGDTGDPRSP